MFNRGHIQQGDINYIDYSARFDGASYLYRDPVGAGDLRAATWSFWVKRSTPGVAESILTIRNTAVTPGDAFKIFFNADDTLSVQNMSGASVDWLHKTTQVFRDTTSWYHICIGVDSDQVTAADRATLEVNGVEVTAYSTETFPVLNADQDFGRAYRTWVGVNWTDAGALNLYSTSHIADFRQILGQKLAASNFGKFSVAKPELWVPKSFDGNHGTNGFHLNFSDAVVPGRDFAGVENKGSTVAGWAWTNTGSVTGSYGTDPYGETTSQISDNDAVSLAYQSNTFSGMATGEYHTANVVLKYIDAKTQYFDAFGGLDVSPVKIFPHPQSGTLSLDGVSDPDYYGVRDLGGGYYHYWFAFNLSGASSGTNIRFGPCNNASAESASTVGSDTGSVEVGAFWISAGSSPIDFPGYSITDEDDTLLNSGLVAADQTVDVPADNFCRWNPLAVHSGGGLGGTRTFSEANSTWAHSAAYGAAVGTLSVDTGQYYWEFTVDALTTYASVGIANPGYKGSGTYRRYYQNDGKKGSDGATASAYGATFTAGDVIGVALDCDAGTLEFFKNNVSQGVAYTDIASAMPVDGWTIFGVINAATVSVDCGQYGYAYSAPTGFKTLSDAPIDLYTSPAVPDPSKEFVVALDTEANIASTLAAARSGWSGYVDIFKNRDSIESWYWRFSADASNCFNSDTVDAKEAFPTLAGSNNWIGYSMKLDGASNIKGGSVSHTNGADTTVTHNAGNARCMIILFHEAGGSRHVYHPDLTSGKLVYLDATTLETTDAAIKNVTANAFDIDTGEATDTIWYLVIPETEGFFDLGSYDGNASTDGPYLDTGATPEALIYKRTDAAGNFCITDAERYDYNPVNNPIFIDDSLTDANGGRDIDFLSRGVKLRTLVAETNAAGSFVYATFAETPAPHTNAR